MPYRSVVYELSVFCVWPQRNHLEALGATVTVDVESDARALATAWLDAIAEALAAHDSGRVASLFRPDGS
jgi:hypothetical protein